MGKNHKDSDNDNTSTNAYISPTSTFFGSFTNAYYTGQTVSQVLVTITDRNYNYYMGAYPATGVVRGPVDAPNANALYYNNPRILVPGAARCGCCDSKPIYVTRIVSDGGL